MYGTVAADHLRSPRNLGRLDAPDGIGHVEEPATDTLVTIYVRLGPGKDGQSPIEEARFRAFGCGGCIIAASVVTGLASGRDASAAAALDASTILAALDGGLPPDQHYCAELVARALRLALDDAVRR